MSDLLPIYEVSYTSYEKQIQARASFEQRGFQCHNILFSNSLDIFALYVEFPEGSDIGSIEDLLKEAKSYRFTRLGGWISASS